ncbi:MAG: ABC transporter substrate-binding protein [Clostridia bacterium]|nr:ABC transporter substrate-binding protein [Clostridia bacterium]
MHSERFWTGKLLFIAFAILLLMFTAVSCSRPDPAASDTQSENDTGADTVTFTDALGRTVNAKRSPERVAALIGSFADVWQLAGGTVCATSEDAWDDFDLSLPDAVNVGTAHSTNAEKLIATSPQLVLASASTASNVKLLETLEAADITVAYFDVDSFEDYLEMLRICTDITGRADLYQKNGLDVKAQIDGIKEAFNERKLSESERTVLLLRASSGFIKAKGSSGTVLGEMLADIGCINIADSDTTLLEDLSVEAVLRASPHRIFVVTMGDDTEKAVSNFNAMINENAAWQSLDAVRQNRIHFMDRKLFNIKPNAKWRASYEQLCDIFKE